MIKIKRIVIKNSNCFVKNKKELERIRKFAKEYFKTTDVIIDYVENDKTEWDNNEETKID